MEDNIKLGEQSFNKMMFVLKNPVTDKNHKDFKFQKFELQEISDGIWAMPVYMNDNDDFTMFFIVTKIESGETVIAFSKGMTETDGKFNLSAPMITGEGLNLLNDHDHEQAKEALHFLNLISKGGEGDWHIIEYN